MEEVEIEKIREKGMKMVIMMAEERYGKVNHGDEVHASRCSQA